MEQNNIILSISLLASNRKETIGKCIESLRPIRDAIATELIIVDTGCDKELHEELCRIADQVVNFAWCNDFAAARNAGLEKAAGQWFLYIDDDEWFTDCQEIIEFFQSGDYQNYGAAAYIQRNYLDMEGSQYTDSWVARINRLDSDTKFTSKIHEQLGPVRGAEKPLYAIVDHYGYVYPDQASKQKHFERNKTLLEQMIAEEPDELRWKLQLMLEFRAMDDYDELETLGKRLLKSFGGIPEEERIPEAETGRYIEAQQALSFDKQVYLGTFYAAVILSELGKENYQMAQKWCQKAQQDKRNLEWTQVFLAFSLARSCYFLGEYEEAEKSAKEYLHWKTLLTTENDKSDERKQMLFEEAKAPFVNEALDDVKQKEIYSILICTGLKRKDTANLQSYFHKLRWEEQHLYVFEGMAEALIEAMCNTGLKNQQVFAAVLPVIFQNQALWRYFVEQISLYEEKGRDITHIKELLQKYLPEALEPQQQESPVELPASQAIDGQTLELQQLANQVKEQLQLLIANGMTEQALEVIGQVRKMMPDDKELAEMEQELRKG